MDFWKILLVVFASLLVIYLSVLAYMFFNQRGFIYYPDKEDFLACQNFAHYQKITYGGTRIYFLNRSGEALVIYHGNAESACRSAFLREIAEATHLSIVFPEYAGYAGDPKAPSKALILKDVENTISFLREKGYSNVSVIGQSLGTGAASYHAMKGTVESLILISPFRRLSDVAADEYPWLPVRLLMTEDYRSDEWLSNYMGRNLIVHGENDAFIPIQHSRRLYSSISGEKRFVAVPGAGHNDLYMYGQVKSEILGFLNQN